MSDEKPKSKINFEELATPRYTSHQGLLKQVSRNLYRADWTKVQTTNLESYLRLWGRSADSYDRLYFESVGLDRRLDTVDRYGRHVDNRIKYDAKRRVHE